MTISSTSIKEAKTCNGSLTAFDFSFPADDSDDVKVDIIDSDGNVTTLTPTTDYELSTVNLDYREGGTVTTVSYDSGVRALKAWASGNTMLIYRETPILQGSEYKNNNALDQKALMYSLDRACMQIRELHEAMDGAVRTKIGETPPDMTLPGATSRASKYLAFDASGSPIASSGPVSGTIPVTAYMETLLALSDLAALLSALTLTHATATQAKAGTSTSVIIDPYVLDAVNKIFAHNSAAATGTDTYAATLAPPISAYAAGQIFIIIFANANTVVAPTLNIDGKGAKTIKRPGGAALQVGNIAAAHPCILRYDGTDLILLNPMELYNPAASLYGLRSLGTGALNACAGNDSRLSDERTPTNGSVSEAKMASSAVAQAKLKTSTGEISVALTAPDDTENATLALPGGEYGFYFQVKQTSITSWGIGSAVGTQTSYASYVNLIANGNTSQTGGTYAQQRYVTSSGEVYWIFVLRDKVTKRVIATWAAPDHPCMGNGGKPLVMPHPFGNFDPSKHEIVVINPREDELKELINKIPESDETKPDRSLLQVVLEEYEIDEKGGSPDWPVSPVTVGLPPGVDWKRQPEGTLLVPTRKVIPDMGFTRRTLRIK